MGLSQKAALGTASIYPVYVQKHPNANNLIIAHLQVLFDLHSRNHYEAPNQKSDFCQISKILVRVISIKQEYNILKFKNELNRFFTMNTKKGNEITPFCLYIINNSIIVFIMRTVNSKFVVKVDLRLSHMENHLSVNFY